MFQTDQFTFSEFIGSLLSAQIFPSPYTVSVPRVYWRSDLSRILVIPRSFVFQTNQSSPYNTHKWTHTRLSCYNFSMADWPYLLIQVALRLSRRTAVRAQTLPDYVVPMFHLACWFALLQDLLEGQRLWISITLTLFHLACCLLFPRTCTVYFDTDLLDTIYQLTLWFFPCRTCAACRDY